VSRTDKKGPKEKFEINMTKPSLDMHTTHLMAPDYSIADLPPLGLRFVVAAVTRAS
jgi:hypothetical protein